MLTTSRLAFFGVCCTYFQQSLILSQKIIRRLVACRKYVLACGNGRDREELRLITDSVEWSWQTATKRHPAPIWHYSPPTHPSHTGIQSTRTDAAITIIQFAYTHTHWQTDMSPNHRYDMIREAILTSAQKLACHQQLKSGRQKN